MGKNINFINMENSEKYFVFGQAIIAGYKETVYLTKDGKLIKDADKEDLMLFDSAKSAGEYIDSKEWEMAEYDKLSNF